MEKVKAVGYALIIVGLFLGIEGTALGFLSRGYLETVNKNLSIYESLGVTATYSPEIANLQSLQVIMPAVFWLSMVKTLAGIACIVLGYSAVKGKK